MTPLLQAQKNQHISWFLIFSIRKQSNQTAYLLIPLTIKSN